MIVLALLIGIVAGLRALTPLRCVARPITAGVWQRPSSCASRRCDRNRECVPNRLPHGMNSKQTL